MIARHAWPIAVAVAVLAGAAATASAQEPPSPAPPAPFTASWVWVGGDASPKNAYAYFRRAIRLRTDPSRAATASVPPSGENATA